MGKIKGIDVILYRSIENEETLPTGEKRKEFTKILVKDVLVAPTSSDDIPTQLDVGRFKELYTLAIPKGDDNIWDDGEVEFFNKRYKVIAQPMEGIEANIPLRWNKKVIVERISS